MKPLTRNALRGRRGALPAALRLRPAIQAALQRHVDNAVSKTINLAAAATPEDVEAIYRSAWWRQLKGITVFREGARGSAVLERGGKGALEAPPEHAGGCKDDRCP